MLAEALKPWKYTLLDGQAALALQSIEIKDTCTEGAVGSSSENLISDSRTRVAANRMEEAMEEGFGLENHEK